MSDHQPTSDLGSATPLIGALAAARRGWWRGDDGRDDRLAEARARADELVAALGAVIPLLGHDHLGPLRQSLEELARSAPLAVEVLATLVVIAGGGDPSAAAPMLDRVRGTAPLDAGAAIDRGLLAGVAEDQAEAEAMVTLARERFGDDWRVVLMLVAFGVPDVSLEEPVARLSAGGAEEVAQVVAAADELANGTYGLLSLTLAAPREEQDLLVEAATARFPSDPVVTALRAGLLVDRDEPAAARALTEQLVGQFPTNAPFLTLHARALLGSGEPAEAKTWLRRAVDSPPAYPDAAALLASLLDDDGDQDGALAVVRSMLEREPTQQLHRLELAYVLELERSDEVEDTFRRALDAHPADATVLTVLVQLAEDDPLRRAEARRRLDRALELEPETPVLHVQLARVLRADERPREALEALERGIALAAAAAGDDHATDPALLEERAALLWDVDRHEEAIAAYLGIGQRERVVELLNDGYADQPPESVLRWLDLLGPPQGGTELALRAEVLRMLGRPSESVRVSQQAVEAFAPDEPPVWLVGTHAQALLDIGSPEQALALVTPLVARDPTYLFGHAVRLMALSWLERYGDAAAVLDEAFGGELPDPWPAWRASALGQLLLETGHLDEAARFLEPLAPDDTDLAAVLGAVRSRQGRHDEAAELLARGAETFNPGWQVERGSALARRDLRHGGPAPGVDATAAYQRAIDDARALPELVPAPRLAAAWAHLLLGDVDEARSLFEPDAGSLALDRAHRAFALLAAGEPDLALRLLDEVAAAVDAIVDRDRQEVVRREVRSDLELLVGLRRVPRAADRALARIRERWSIHWADPADRSART